MWGSVRIVHFSNFNNGEVEMDMRITLVILHKWPYLFCLKVDDSDFINGHLFHQYVRIMLVVLLGLAIHSWY